LCSVLAVTLIADRFWNLRPSRVIPHDLLDTLGSLARAQPGQTRMESHLANTSLGELIAEAWRIRQEHPDCDEHTLRQSLEGAGRVVLHQLERYLVALGTIASAAPLLGLLGTIVGMIEIFGASNGVNTHPGQLAHGISIALYNTAIGLIIAIPSLVAWRYFRQRVDTYALILEQSMEHFLRHATASDKLPRGKV
jgi:biopolymer transport protein ExbB